MHEPDTEAINAGTRPQDGYEERDLNLKPLIYSTFWFFTGTTICIVLTYIGFLALVEVPIRPTTKPAVIPGKPYPLMQGNMATQVDIAKHRHEEDQKTQTYGWIDEQKGVAHIPVEKAIDLVEERGLTSTQTPTLEGDGKL